MDAKETSAAATCLRDERAPRGEALDLLLEARERRYERGDVRPPLCRRDHNGVSPIAAAASTGASRIVA